MPGLLRHRVIAVVAMVTWLAAPTHELKSRTYEEFAEKDENITYPTPEDAMERKLIVTTRLEAPWVMLKYREPGRGVFLTGRQRFDGFLVDVLDYLAEIVGFDYDLRLVQDGQLGGPGENGSWTGMIGEVSRGEADLAAAPLTVNHDAVEVIDFSEPFMTLRSAAIIQKPRKRRPPRKSRLRSVQDLLSSDYQYGVIGGSITEGLFRIAYESTYRGLWSQMNKFWPSAFVHSVQEGVQRVRREKYAFILDLPMAQYLATRKPCDLYVTEPFLNVREYAFALQKGDPLKSELDREIVRLRRSGDMEHIHKKWWTSDCNNKRAAKGEKGNEKGLFPGSTPITPWRFGTAEGYDEYNRSSLAHKHQGSRYCVATAVALIAVVQMFTCGGHFHHGNHTRREV